jgi:RecA-family ATPase
MQNEIKPLPLPILNPPKPQSLNTASFSHDANVLHLPEIDQASSLLKNRSEKPAEIIEGVIHAGTKAVLASGSKVGKTWILLDLATAVATGTPWR